jgi:hypothetical protein
MKIIITRGTPGGFAMHFDIEWKMTSLQTKFCSIGVAFITLALIVSSLCLAADPVTRYKIPNDLKTYPQGSAKETLQSLIKAVEAKNVGYILAHLADPEWVDGRVKEYGQSFEALFKEAKAKLIEDPSALKLLKRFEKDGTWESAEFKAEVKLKDVADKFHKIGDVWFLENEYKVKGK